jgi:hypothetical protein
MYFAPDGLTHRLAEMERPAETEKNRESSMRNAILLKFNFRVRKKGRGKAGEYKKLG